MRTIAVISGILILTGCATIPKQPYAASPSDQEVKQCQDEAANTSTSTLAKTLIWASNIIVLPLTTGLTLGTMPTIVYPRDDAERRPHVYKACLARLGY